MIPPPMSPVRGTSCPPLSDPLTTHPTHPYFTSSRSLIPAAA